MKKLEPTELRIGNLVYDREGHVTKVENINPLVERTRTAIPLTEEWLVRFGFEFDEYSKCFHNQIAIYGNSKNGFTYNALFFEHENLIEISFVHQLQNLYFAIEQSELTAN